MKLCPKCGTAICEDEESCSFCGEKIPDASPVIKTDESKKTRITALLLGIFLGNAGAHDFYLGKKVRGIIHVIITFLTIGMNTASKFFEELQDSAISFYFRNLDACKEDEAFSFLSSYILSFMDYKQIFHRIYLVFLIINTIWAIIEIIIIWSGAGKDSDGFKLTKWNHKDEVKKEDVSAKSNTTTAVLGFFLGGLGVQNFYCGRIKKALLQLLLVFTIFAAAYGITMTKPGLNSFYEAIIFNKKIPSISILSFLLYIIMGASFIVSRIIAIVDFTYAAGGLYKDSYGKLITIDHKKNPLGDAKTALPKP